MDISNKDMNISARILRSTSLAEAKLIIQENHNKPLSKEDIIRIAALEHTLKYSFAKTPEEEKLAIRKAYNAAEQRINDIRMVNLIAHTGHESNFR